MSNIRSPMRYFHAKLVNLFLLILALTVLLFFVRDRDANKPLTNETLDVLSRTGIVNASVKHRDGRLHILNQDESDSMRLLIKSLGPIRSHKPGSLETYEYELNYQGGMDPTSIFVHLESDRLIFEWHGLVYEGGEPAKFEETIMKLMRN